MASSSGIDMTPPPGSGGASSSGIDMTPPPPDPSLYQRILGVTGAMRDFTAGPQPLVDLAARTGARVISGIPNLVGLVQSGQNIPWSPLDLTASETGQQPSEEQEKATTPAPSNLSTWLPSESLIKGLGIEEDPNAGPAMKTADTLLPWLVPNGNQLTRVQEAAGGYNKLMTGLRSGAGAVGDWALSDAAQQFAQEHGFGPVATTLAGMFGGSVRAPVTRVLAPGAPAIVGAREDAGPRFDAQKALLPPEILPGTPEGVVPTSTVPPFKDVADPDSGIARLLSGAGVIPFSGTGEATSVKAQTGAIARTADAGLKALDPDTTPVMQAGPASLRQEGSTLKNQAQDTVLNEERRLMDESDAIDRQIGLERDVDATPLRTVAAQLADPTNRTVGKTVKDKAQEVLNTIDGSIGPDGKITYGALKKERETFNQFLNGLDPESEASLARTLSPIKQEMTQAMGDAANDAGVGAQWAKNDAGWTQQANTKRDLAALSGGLNRTRTDFDPSPGGKQVAKVISNAVEGEGKAGIAPIQRIETGLGEQPARSAVAETIAAMGRPKNAKNTQAFTPSTFGEGVQSRVDDGIMDYIGAKAGPGARMNIENAAKVGSNTSEPLQQGGFRKGISNILSVAPYVGPLAAVFHPAAAAFSPLVSSMSNDPDFIRAMAWRSRPASELATQALTRAGLGAIPAPAIRPLDVARQGAGMGWDAASGVANTILNYLKPQAAAGQR